jgi:hypothetical protein
LSTQLDSDGAATLALRERVSARVTIAATDLKKAAGWIRRKIIDE